MENNDEKIIKFKLDENYYDKVDYFDEKEQEEDSKSSKTTKWIKIFCWTCAVIIVVTAVMASLPGVKENRKVLSIEDVLESYSLSDEYNAKDLTDSFDLGFEESSYLNAFLTTNNKTIETTLMLMNELDKDDSKQLETITERFKDQAVVLEDSILDYVKQRSMNALSDYDNKTFNEENFSRILLDTIVENSEGKRYLNLELYQTPYEGCSYDNKTYTIKITDKDLLDCMDAWSNINAIADKNYTSLDKEELKRDAKSVLEAIATVSVNDESNTKAKEKSSSVKLVKSKNL